MPWTYRPALDGLRSVAVYLVLLFHTGMATMGGGFIGVDLFFVLSGFLVSNVILSEIDGTGRLSLGKFYARRVRRLLPAALVVVVATSAVFLLLFPVVRRLDVVADAQSALLYYANWNFLFQQNDYFATGVDESPFLHFWSLAIEEQFYVVFPILLVLLVKAGRRRKGLVLGTLTLLLLASLGSQLYWAQRDLNWAYYGTDARLYQLLAGAVLAVTMRSLHSARPRGVVADAMAWVGLAGLLVLGSRLVDVSPSTRGIGATLAAVTVIGALMSHEAGTLSRLLARPLPVYLGKISYGIYLWHWPVILVVAHVLETRPLVIALVAGTLSTALAALSYEVLEHPVRISPALSPYRWTVVITGVATSVLIALTVVPPVLESDRRPVLATTGPPPVSAVHVPSDDLTRAERNAPVPDDIDWESLRVPTPKYPLCTPQDLDACTLVEGDGPHVVLVGDSYGRMFAPMFIDLAEKHGFKLSHNSIPGCPWQADIVLNRLTQEQRRNCLAQRADWYDEVLPELDADLVVLTQMHRDSDPAEGGQADRDVQPLSRLGGSDESSTELLYNTTRETVELITGQGLPVVMFESLPVPQNGKDPLECLGSARTLNECSMIVPEEPMSDVFYRTVAAITPRAHSIDLMETFCYGYPQCLPMVEGVVTWGDANHLSMAVAQLRQDEVWDLILGTGVLEGSRDSHA